MPYLIALLAGLGVWASNPEVVMACWHDDTLPASVRQRVRAQEFDQLVEEHRYEEALEMARCLYDELSGKPRQPYALFDIAGLLERLDRLAEAGNAYREVAREIDDPALRREARRRLRRITKILQMRSSRETE